jgi:hypothetical protein
VEAAVVRGEEDEPGPSPRGVGEDSSPAQEVHSVRTDLVTKGSVLPLLLFVAGRELAQLAGDGSGDADHADR